MARRFWLEGASLLLTARSHAALADLAASLPAHGGQRVFVFSCDLADPDAPNLIARQMADRFGNLHVLVNNAAIQGPIGPSWTHSGSEWEEAIRVDFLSPAALCRRCIPLMKGDRRCKIINISGGGATSARPYFSAYAAAKTGLVRFSECLAAEIREMEIDVNCVAPGAMPTAMTDAILNAGPSSAGVEEYESAWKLRQRNASKIDRAVDLCVFLGSAASDGISGRLLSAVWDSWAQLPARREELEKSDVYTLRRITPKDRGFDWE